MKFRAVMQDLQYIREFQNLVNTLTKLSKECVLKISKDKLTFIVNEESSTLSPLVWADINVLPYFTTYAMEGVNDSNPSILLAMSTANFARAFVSARNNPRHLKMKLTNIQFPCLTVETETMIPNATDSRSLVHDVPVNVIPCSDWCAYTVPQIPNCTLIVQNMPSNRLMRGVIDKLKNLAPNIIFYATSSGELNLVAETETVTITTRYKNLEIRACSAHDDDGAANPNGNGNRINDNNALTSASCSVDCKKTSMFFTALQMSTSDAYCGISDEQCIHLEVNVRDGVIIHSILPAVCV